MCVKKIPNMNCSKISIMGCPQIVQDGHQGFRSSQRHMWPSIPKQNFLLNISYTLSTLNSYGYLIMQKLHNCKKRQSYERIINYMCPLSWCSQKSGFYSKFRSAYNGYPCQSLSITLAAWDIKWLYLCAGERTFSNGFSVVLGTALSNSCRIHTWNDQI